MGVGLRRTIAGVQLFALVTVIAVCWVDVFSPKAGMGVICGLLLAVFGARFASLLIRSPKELDGEICVRWKLVAVLIAIGLALGLLVGAVTSQSASIVAIVGLFVLWATQMGVYERPGAAPR